ncbi:MULTISPECIES: hypothetical protein [unclassified Blastococcus]
MTATNPQPGDPGTGDAPSGGRHSGADPEGVAGVKRGLRRVLLGLLALVVVAAIAVGISRCGPDDGPSGNDPSDGSAVPTLSVPGS